MANVDGIVNKIKRQQTSLGKDEVEFQHFESKIDEVLHLLKGMNNCDKKCQNPSKEPKKDLDKWNTFSENEFLVKVTEDRTVINTKDTDTSAKKGNLDKLAFMQEFERDAARRAEERKEREAITQNLRKKGNEAFRNGEYEKAISMYSKAIDHIKDSPVLYNNRALAYIRLGLFKKAIIDVDFVLQKLDEKNIRAWLYRAKSYYLLGEKRDFEKSVNEAKKSNPKELDFIEKTVAHIFENKN